MSLFLSADVSGILTEFFANFSVAKLLPAVVLAVICIIVIKILLKLVDRILSGTQMQSNVKKMVRLVLKVILLFVAVIIVLNCLGVPVTSLVALLSVLGLAVSLAVQSFLSNVAGGLQLAASKPFREGDYVEAAGTAGTVIEIGLFYTKLTSPDNKLIQIPNSSIVGSNIVNYSSEANRRVEINVSVSYDTPIKKVKEAAGRLVKEHPLTLADPEPQIGILKYGDSAIQYTIRVWCANSDYWTVYFDLMEGLKSAFDAAGVEMTYPHIKVHMVEK